MSVIDSFERELLEKIRQKSKSRQSMDSFLFKSFKFFDLSGNGRLSQSDFFKAIAKCGVVVQPRDLSTVFSHYAGESDCIEYQKFIDELVYREDEIDSNASRLKFSQKSQLFSEGRGLAASKTWQEEKPVLKESKVTPPPVKLQNYDQVLAYIKSNIQAEGLGSLLSLAVKLKLTDKRKSHLIDRSALTPILPFLTNEHFSLIFDQLSQNGKEIDYSVLVYDLKGQIDEEANIEIDKAFRMLDSRRQGQFPIDYLISRYLSRNLQEQFKQAINLYTQFQGIDDSTFTEDDFNDFLGFLSFDYNTLQDFSSNIIRPFYEDDNRSSLSQKSNRTRDFQLNKSQKPFPENNADFRKDKRDPVEAEETFSQFHEELHEEDKKSVSRYSQFEGHEATNSRKLKEFESVILRIKRRLATKGTRGFLQLERAMKTADIDQDTLLNAEEFTQVIKAQRIDITPTECGSVFDLFDSEGAGLISFGEFMFALRGSMPQSRRELAQKLWGQVRGKEDTASFSRLRHLLNFRSHPDVQNGRRHEEDIWKEIQETILSIQQLNGGPRSDTVTQAEFLEYMENLSLAVADDRLFQSILLNFWRLDNSSSILEKYAGSRKLFDHAKNGYLMDHHRNYVQGGTVSQNAPFGTFHEPTTYTTEHRRL